MLLGSSDTRLGFLMKEKDQKNFFILYYLDNALRGCHIEGELLHHICKF